MGAERENEWEVIRSEIGQCDNDNFCISSEGCGLKFAREIILPLLRIAFPERNLIEGGKGATPDLIVQSTETDQEPLHPSNAPYVVWSHNDDILFTRPYRPIFYVVEHGESDATRGVFYVPPVAGAYAECRRRGLLVRCESPPLTQRIAVGCIGEVESWARCARAKFGCGAVAYATHYGDPAEAIREYSQFMYVLVADEPNTVSGTLLYVLLAGAVPVYCEGDAGLAQRLFHPEALVCAENFESAAECIHSLPQEPSLPAMFGESLHALFRLHDEHNLGPIYATMVLLLRAGVSAGYSLDDQIYPLVEAVYLLDDVQLVQRFANVHRVCVNDTVLSASSGVGRFFRHLTAIRAAFSVGYQTILLVDSRAQSRLCSLPVLQLPDEWTLLLLDAMHSKGVCRNVWAYVLHRRGIERVCRWYANIEPNERTLAFLEAANYGAEYIVQNIKEAGHIVDMSKGL